MLEGLLQSYLLDLFSICKLQGEMSLEDACKCLLDKDKVHKNKFKDYEPEKFQSTFQKDINECLNYLIENKQCKKTRKSYFFKVIFLIFF